MQQNISLIVAMNHERVIGSDNQLPWHIPEDLNYFKQVTLGKPIIMGRKTFESIGRVLPERKNVVISRSDYHYPGVVCYHSLSEAIQQNSDFTELCIIGGGEIFKQAIKFATKLHITEVDFPVNNPCAWFPDFDKNNWNIIASKQFVSSSGIHCCIKEYIKNVCT